MSEAIGFKEWQSICAALAAGKQSLLFRKGGIHEGRAGFSFANESFFLFPTRFHAQPSQITDADFCGESLPEFQLGEEVVITHYAETLWAKTISDVAVLDALAPYHIYQKDVLHDRFFWEGKGMPTGSIHVALVRVFALAEPWRFPYAASYGGCRSWLKLPEPPTNWEETLTPVLGMDVFASLVEGVEHVVESAPSH